MGKRLNIATGRGPKADHRGDGALAVRAGRGDRAAQGELVRRSAGLLHAIARHYRDAYPGSETEDLLQDGAIGLLRAARTFDPGRAQWSTYATFWVRHAVQRSASVSARAIAIPTNLDQDAHAHRRAAEARGLDPLADFDAVAATRPPDERHSPDCLRAALRSRSLRRVDVDPRGGDASALGPIPDPRAADPAEAACAAVDDADRRRRLLAAIIRLDEPRERRILRLRYGLYGKPPETLTSLSGRLGLSRERISQLQRVAEAKLRDLLGPDFAEAS